MSNSDPKRPKAVIFGCAGTELTDEERRFFAAADPLGFILFARNCDHPAQVRALTEALRQSVGRADAPVLIDQEGGRVRRLRPPHWRDVPAPGRFGEVYGRDAAAATEAVRINARLIAAELVDLGIDVNCLPVLDLPIDGAHQAIGDRAFSGDPAIATRLGEAALAGLTDQGVTGVIKHMPGQGRARVDSHHELPVVDAGLDDLAAHDLAPFRALSGHAWGMTGHVLYPAVDADLPATLSPRVIATLIRGAIGFDGLLLTDDLNMSALSGALEDRAAAAVAAGCDIALHCSGVLAEMRRVAAKVPGLSEDGERRCRRNRRPMVQSQAAERQQLTDRLAELLA